MKTIQYLLGMLGIAAMMASCSQSEDVLQADASAKSEEVQMTFNVQTPAIQTRAVDAESDEKSVGRYVCQLWEAGNDTEPYLSKEQSNPQFTLLLKKNTHYTLLLWADNGTPKTDGETDADKNNYYNTANLKEVSVVQPEATDKDAELAFYAYRPVEVTSSVSIGTVELSHAVAKVCLYETNAIAANSTLSVAYTPARTFNVADGIATAGENKNTLNFNITDGADATTGQAEGIRIARFYVLASEGGENRELFNFSFTLNEQKDKEPTVKSVGNVPLQANHITNIRGEFSDYTTKGFSMELNRAWETEGYETVFPLDMNKKGITTAAELGAYLQPFTLGRLEIKGILTPDNIAVLKTVFSSNKWSYVLDLSAAEFTAPLVEGAFGGQKGVKGLILPPNLEKITNSLVFTAGTWEFITLPASLKEIGWDSFNSCERLKQVNLDETQVTVIPSGTFYGCLVLEEIALGNVTELRSNSFRKCPKLRILDLSKCTQVPTITTQSFPTFALPDESNDSSATNPSQITVYVKDEDMKAQFAANEQWAAQGFTAEKFVVKQ